VRFLGDSALLVDIGLADETDGAALLAANARALALADTVRAAHCTGVRDIVPAMASVTIHLDPLRADVAALHALIEHAMRAAPDRSPRDVPVIDVPVTYGGADGPDLATVAAATGLAPDEVVARHAAVEYRVCYLGFLPGFPYLGLVDERLRLPRRATPRSRVAAGSVAIADRFSGIYPTTSPGGWHIIGRTALPLFDVTATPPARLMPGDRVRFVRSAR
jgi:KipI family sensor histidine kinase inhibitor